MGLSTSPLDNARLQDGTLSTGISVLDSELLQGIPAGSTVAILGDPSGMAELFLYHLVHTDRQTHYVSTVRPARYIEETLSAMGDLDASKVNVEDIYSTSESASDIINKHAARVAENDNLVVDTLSNAYDDDHPEKFLQTLRNLYQYVNDNDGLAYLYFANNDISSFNRAEREALHMCDAVFRITTAVAGDNIETRLNILKMRGRDLPTEQIKLNVGQKLTIDTTRDIA